MSMYEIELSGVRVVLDSDLSVDPLQAPALPRPGEKDSRLRAKGQDEADGLYRGFTGESVDSKAKRLIRQASHQEAWERSSQWVRKKFGGPY